MKRLISLFFALFMLVSMTACSNVNNGYVGVKVDRYGDNRGVQATVLGPGRYFLGWNTDLYEFPTYTVTEKWTKSPAEGKAADESVSFQIAGGIVVNTDLAVAFHVKPEDVPRLFQKYHRGIEEISDNFLRNMVRDELNTAGLKYQVEDLQGAGKAKLMAEVIEGTKSRAAEVGIAVESVSFLNELRFPPNVVASINAKIQATQDAMRVENEVRKTEAEQHKLVVAAEAQVKVAEAEAKGIALKGEAYRNNPQVLQLEIVHAQANALANTKVQVLGTMPTLFRDVANK